MITLRDSVAVGSTGKTGIWLPGVTTFGAQVQSPADTIFIQNDSSTDPASPWYVTRVDATHYTMLSATPKNSQYIGAFIWSGATDTRGDRVGSAVTWETSDASVVKIGSVTASGQAYINILTGTATLTATLNGMTSTLLITAA